MEKSKYFDNGGRPRLKHTVREMCYQCCNGFFDGRHDCEIVDCPVYCLQPYRDLEPDFSWRTNGSHLQANSIAYRYGVKPSGEGVSVPPLNSYGRPPKREIIRATCFKCMGDLADGRFDCEVVDCPFYHWQPYRRLDPDFSWVENGLRIGGNRREIRDAEKTRRRNIMEKSG